MHTPYEKVIEGECSLSELKARSAELKNVKALKAAFVKLTNTNSWEEAQESFLLFATENNLHRYIHIDLRKCTPPKKFQHAKATTSATNEETK